MKTISVFEELHRLRKELEHFKRQASDWQKKYYEAANELEITKALLNQFLNSNTPSSQLLPQFKPTNNTRPDKGSRPKGKPAGSNGGTKEPPSKIDKKINVKCPKFCSNCKSKLKIEEYTWFVYEMEPIKINVIEVKSQEGYCEKCGIIHKGSHPEVPSEGTIGPNLEAFITELKHNFAGSYVKIPAFIEDLSGVSFSHTAINDCIERVANKLEPSYKEMEEQLPQTTYSHSDETSWPVDGDRWWLWLFITVNFTFLTIQKSRARKILTNFFGEEYPGVIISDCLRVYRQFAAAFQKDWSHLLRKTHFEADKFPNRSIVRLHEELKAMYDAVEEFQKTNPSFEQRTMQSIMYHQKLQRIVNHKWSNPAQQIVDDWLKAYEGQWLIPVIMPGIAMTNNVNERGIRKVIPSRKLLGGHRTEKGARNFAIIETHRQTWKQKGKSPYISLVKFLKNKNTAAAG